VVPLGLGCEGVGSTDIEHIVVSGVECVLADGVGVVGHWKHVTGLRGSSEYDELHPDCDGDLQDDLGFSSGDSHGVGGASRP